MNKRLKKFIAFAACTTAGIYYVNRIINKSATTKNLLTTDNGNFYNWRNGDVYYTVQETGTPILLIHDLHPASSSVEWSLVLKRLEKKYKVYCIDLPGCGRSDKPAITYTNYFFVQLINDFVKDIIKEKTTLVATGASASFSIMTNIMNPENFAKVIVINPESISELMLQPNKRKNIYKNILDFPIFGTFLYNIEMKEKNIANKLQYNNYSNSHNIPATITNMYYEAAHLGNEKGRHLLSSIRGNYTSVNIGHAISKIDNLSIISSKDRIENMKIVDEYTKLNSKTDSISISGSKYLPQLEVPERFCDILNKLIATK